MFQNYIKTAIRNLLKYKSYSLISIAGLAVGLASSILIFLFIFHELSHDKFHKNSKQIFRACLKFNMGANQFDSPYCPVPLAPTLVEEYSEIKTATRLYHLNYRNKYVYVKYKDKQFKELNFLWTDSTVFNVFTIPLIAGDPSVALSKPNSVILTSETAKKYFGNDNPMGKMFTLQDGSLYEVTGIAKKMPLVSHFHFDFLASFSSVRKSRDPEWYDTAVYTYFVLQDNFDWHVLNDKLPELSRKYVSPIIERAMGMSYDNFLQAGNYFGFFIEPLLDIHLYSNVDNGLGKKGNINTVLVFAGIALLILIIAGINFVNLATARSTIRANEVGVRKIVGSSRKQLILQFLSESIITSIISLFIALIIVNLFLPSMNNLLGIELSFISGWQFLLLILVVILIVGFLAGSYPAFLLSSFMPIEVLKGKIQSGKKGRFFRKLLVVFQFAASIVLITGTIVVYHQLQFMRNKDLGFIKEQIVIIQNVNMLAENQKSFKDQLLQQSEILSATYTDCLPQMMLEVKPFQKIGEESNENHTLITISSDFDFKETFQVTMKDGRYFDKSFATDSNTVIINQAAVSALNFGNPLSEALLLLGRNQRKMDIIGVINDFHTETIHEPIKPMAAILIRNIPGEFLSARIQPGRIRESLELIEKQWNNFVPNQPLEFTFFDDQFNQAYQSEIQSEKVISVFSALAILIACMGLFGLASFTVMRRTKEIGIRKVLGASVSGTVFLLSRDFLKWVIIANVVAWPVAWYAMNSWLQSFAYKVELTLLMFLAGGFLAFIIAIFTVSMQTVKAAVANPVEALRYE